MALFSDFISLNLFIKDTPSLVYYNYYTWNHLFLGSEVAENTSDWRWGLRVTPFMGLLAILLIIFFMIDPERGLFCILYCYTSCLFTFYFLRFNIELTKLFTWKYTGHADGAHLTPGSPKEDLTALAKNKSYMLSLAGFTCVTFTGQ